MESLLTVLVILMVAQVVFTILACFWQVNCLTAIHSVLCRQNRYLLHWRREFAQTFSYIEEEDDLDSIWGDEEQEVR